jgi:type IV pilus assembly protein PilB
MLGEKLLEKGIITQEQLAEALEEQRWNPGVRLGTILVNLGYVTQKQVEENS